jgi:hypothetical protein
MLKDYFHFGAYHAGTCEFFITPALFIEKGRILGEREDEITVSLILIWMKWFISVRFL